MGFFATSLGDTLWLGRVGDQLSHALDGQVLAGLVFASTKNPASMPWAPFAASNGLVYADGRKPDNRGAILRPFVALGRDPWKRDEPLRAKAPLGGAGRVQRPGRWLVPPG